MQTTQQALLMSTSHIVQKECEMRHGYAENIYIIGIDGKVVTQVFLLPRSSNTTMFPISWMNIHKAKIMQVSFLTEKMFPGLTIPIPPSLSDPTHAMNGRYNSH